MSAEARNRGDERNIFEYQRRDILIMFSRDTTSCGTGPAEFPGVAHSLPGRVGACAACVSVAEFLTSRIGVFVPFLGVTHILPGRSGVFAPCVSVDELLTMLGGPWGHFETWYSLAAGR